MIGYRWKYHKWPRLYRAKSWWARGFWDRVQQTAWASPPQTQSAPQVRVHCPSPVDLGSVPWEQHCGRKMWGYTEHLLLGTRAVPTPPALLWGVPWNIFEINVSWRGSSITFCLNSLQWVMGKVFLFRKLGFLFWMPLIKTNDVSLVVRLSQQLRKSSPRYKAGEGCNPQGSVASQQGRPRSLPAQAP